MRHLGRGACLELRNPPPALAGEIAGPPEPFVVYDTTLPVPSRPS